MKFSSLLSFFLFITSICFSQFSFIKEMSFAPYHVNIKVTNDGGWLLPFGQQLIKFNSCGDVEWSKKYEVGEKFFYQSDIVIAQDGSIFLCGAFIGGVIVPNLPTGFNLESFIFKLDSIGNPIWFYVYKAGDQSNPNWTEIISIATNISEASNGNFFVQGRRSGSGKQFVFYIDSDGNPLWLNNYFSHTEKTTIKSCTDDGLLISNNYSIYPSPINSRLIYKIDSIGNVVWGDTSRHTITQDIIEVDNGYLCLAHHNILDFSFTYLLDFDGNFLQQGATFSGIGERILKISNGNFLVVGLDENDKRIRVEISLIGEILNKYSSTNTPAANYPKGVRFDFFADNSIIFSMAGKIAKTKSNLELTCQDSISPPFDIDFEMERSSFSSFAKEPMEITFIEKEVNVIDTQHDIQNICEEYYLIDTQIDTSICEGHKLQFDVGFPGAESFTWQDGSTQSNIEITTAGTYSVDILHCNFITTKTFNVLDGKCNCAKIPNAFTPDGDGINDNFSPLYKCEVKNLDFKIFNRWGEIVFSTKDINEKWDGTHRGNSAASDVYVYILSFENELGNVQRLQGDVTLIK